MVSVIVITYNSQLKKILFTLKTIISQKHKDFEIIISDDGSKVSYKNDILDFFNREKFVSYRYIENKVNVGTVKNIIGALDIAKGEYITIFGAGDGFYNFDSMARIVEYIENTNSEVFFGLMNSYYKNSSGKLFFRPFCLPCGIIDIKKKNSTVQKNVVFYKDNICGAAICYKSEIIKEYLKKSVDYIKYVEDICVLEMLIDGIDIGLVDEYLFWYEGSSGISNTNNKKSVKMLRDDEIKYYDYLMEKHIDNRWIKKRKKNKILFCVPGKYLRMIVVSFFHPYRIVLFIKKYISKYIRCDYGKYCVDECFVGFIKEM